MTDNWTNDEAGAERASRDEFTYGPWDLDPFEEIDLSEYLDEVDL